MKLICFLTWLIISFSGAAQDPVLNIMTFNIRYAGQHDGINNWENRRPLVTSLIRFHDADIVGVQEAHRRQLDDIILELPEFGWVGVCRTDGMQSPEPDNEFSAILFRKDRFRVLDDHTFWLSPSPATTGSIGWDAALPRIVTYARFQDTQTGKQFFLFNTHFDHVGKTARAESAKLLLHVIDSLAGDSPVVVTGDFNFVQTEFPYEILTGDNSRLRDAFYFSIQPHYGPTATFAGNFEVSGLSDRRIDYIFTSENLNVVKHATLSDSWNGRFASDHLPVLAKIIF